MSAKRKVREKVLVRPTRPQEDERRIHGADSLAFAQCSLPRSSEMRRQYGSELLAGAFHTLQNTDRRDRILALIGLDSHVPNNLIDFEKSYDQIRESIIQHCEIPPDQIGVFTSS